MYMFTCMCIYNTSYSWIQVFIDVSLYLFPFRFLGSIKDSPCFLQAGLGLFLGPFIGLVRLRSLGGSFPLDWVFRPILQSLCEFCSLWVMRFPCSFKEGLALLSSLQGLLSFCCIRSLSLPRFTRVGVFSPFLGFSFFRPCNWKDLQFLWNSFGARLAPGSTFSLGMQISGWVYMYIYIDPLAVFSPFVPCQRLSFLREFRGVTLSLSGTGLSFSWTFRELSLLCFRVSFLEEIGFIFSLP